VVLLAVVDQNESQPPLRAAAFRNLRRRFKLVNANDNWYLRGITDDRAVPDCIANGV
jgi:hypothetical protein